MKTWEDTVMTHSQMKTLWDEELPTLFKETVFDPEMELFAFGDEVAEAQAELSFKAGQQDMVEWLEKRKSTGRGEYDQGGTYHIYRILDKDMKELKKQAEEGS